MHLIEPYFNWRNLYTAEDDKMSPFYKRTYSEFYFTNAIYDHYIHPQWDEFGSPTLYMKILFVDYELSFCIIELLGEWNDCINNDVMFLKRDVADVLMKRGITKFILIGENVLNFHHDGDDYYDEWYQDVEDGWIAAINFHEHVISEFKKRNIDYYLNFGGEMDTLNWRTLDPLGLFQKVDGMMQRRIG
ncbi:MAG: hypothetical protein NTX03_04235 [Bacteroidetes bacterium]|nr:hypothetical protein [Bacteroidota bacterium]